MRSGKEGSIADSDSLFESNIIDSFGMIELVSFIQEEFKIQINQSEIALEYFDSLDKIAQLIKRKQH